MATEERDYSHRSAVQKLGVKPEQRVEITGDVGSGLRRDVKEAVGRGLVRSGELDGAIVLVESEDEGREALVRYRARLRDTEIDEALHVLRIGFERRLGTRDRSGVDLRPILHARGRPVLNGLA